MRSIRGDDAEQQLEELEEWVGSTPEQLVERRAARRRAAAAALGIQVGGEQ